MAIVPCEFPLDEVAAVLHVLKTHRPRSPVLGRAIKELERADARARNIEANQKRERDRRRRERTARIPDESLIPQSMSRRTKV